MLLEVKTRPGVFTVATLFPVSFPLATRRSSTGSTNGADPDVWLWQAPIVFGYEKRAVAVKAKAAKPWTGENSHSSVKHESFSFQRLERSAEISNFCDMACDTGHQGVSTNDGDGQKIPDSCPFPVLRLVVRPTCPDESFAVSTLYHPPKETR